MRWPTEGEGQMTAWHPLPDREIDFTYDGADVT
jgi:hypothetical protein